MYQAFDNGEERGHLSFGKRPLCSLIGYNGAIKAKERLV